MFESWHSRDAQRLSSLRCATSGFVRAGCVAASLLACNPGLAQIAATERQTFTAAQLISPEAHGPLPGIASRPPAPATHRLNLSVVRLEGSGWTRERAFAALREAAPILAQCGVALAKADLVTLAVPPRALDFSTPTARELALAHPVPRPAIYLVRNTRSRPAFDAEAIGRANSRTRPELADTVWITAEARDPGIVLAHELAHVLMDSGEHSEAPGNLMRDETSPRNTALAPDQCARLRATAAAHGLLEKIP